LRQAEIAQGAKLASHVKVGKCSVITESRLALTKAASCNSFGNREPFLMADANRGYKA